MNIPGIDVTTIVSFPFQENSYVFRAPTSSECVVVDPGLEPSKILEFMDSEQLAPSAILNTHGHSDHIGGNQALKERWPEVPLVIGQGDASKLTNPEENLSAAFGTPFISPEADAQVSHGQVYSAGGFDLEVREIPGHCRGHVIYLWKGPERYAAFVGDVIFAGSIGRTDFPDGNTQDLLSGIRKHVFDLPDDTVLFSGHGQPTTVGEEERSNPFVGRRAMG